MDFIEFNGKILPKNQEHLSVIHSSVYYGLSVYETCFVIDNKVACWEEHVQRMKSSLDFVQIQIHNDLFEELKSRI
jgi:branched-subunit amino acid aminotransferase/4-amino-4-deoxychorismate lyase